MLSNYPIRDRIYDENCGKNIWHFNGVIWTFLKKTTVV